MKVVWGAIAGTVALVLSALSAQAQTDAPSLLRIAETMTTTAEATRNDAMLWGRLGGRRAERNAAELVLLQLRDAVDDGSLESFEFRAYRPVHWRVALKDRGPLESAMPAPFDAWFPDVEPAPLVVIESELDWGRVSGSWAFVEASMQGSPANTNVRRDNLFQRAVENGAAGLIFSLPTPPGDWRAVVPVDKAFTKRDERYPDHRRPIPAFCVSSDDGVRLREAARTGALLSSEIEFALNQNLEGRNAVGVLRNGLERSAMIACHLDSFFSGANDDASGIAVMIGLARELAKLTPDERRVNFVFAGLSGHHDEGAGMRAFMDSDPARAVSIEGVILLEHLDAHTGELGEVPGWPESLNDLRAAYVGPQGWEGMDESISEMAKRSGLMDTDPRIVADCIADLYVVCGQKLTFCLIQAPPFYHTNHDTLDKLTEKGLQNAVDFHLEFLLKAGYITRRP